MARKLDEVARTRIVGRISRQPEGATTSGGVPVCRLVVVKKAAGPLSTPVQVGLYVKGELAQRCAAGLNEGDLVESFGDLGAPRKAARYPELMADVVRLWERAPGAGVAA